MPVAADGKKVCSKCKIEHPATNEFFPLNTQSKDNFSCNCKSCKHAQYEKHKHKILKKQSIYSIENKNHQKEYIKLYYQKNQIKLDIYKKDQYEDNKEKLSIKNAIKYVDNKYNIKIYKNAFAKYETYNENISLYEETICDENGFLQVKCTYCDKQFNITNQQCNQRLNAINGNIKGEGRLYCSDGCKQSCPIYKQRSYPKGFKVTSSREVDQLLRKMALKRDNYTCQNKECNKTVEEIALHVHHIEGATEQPLLSNDLDNVITYCKTCHKEVHKKIGCTYNDYKCK